MFRTIINYEPYKGEINNQPDMTIPDQTMSIRTILSRYAHGFKPESIGEPVYHGEDEYIPDPRTLDLVDRQEMHQNISNRVAELMQKAQTEGAEKAPDGGAKQGGEADAVEN